MSAASPFQAVPRTRPHLSKDTCQLNFETRRYPIREPGLEKQQKEEESSQPEPARPLPAPKAQLGPLKQAKVVDSSSDVQTSPPASASPALVQPASSPDTGRYIVQVASFGTLANANKLSDTLRSNGYAVMTDSVKSDVGTLHRVRVGPYVSQAESNGIVAELESRISGIKPRVMDLQPEKNAQITTPSDPLIRWIVQVGSFSSAANAEKLVASLRLDGLSAYQETVSSSGSSIYRVRIGPYLQREEAIRIESLVQEKRSLDGVVMSVD